MERIHGASDSRRVFGRVGVMSEAQYLIKKRGYWYRPNAQGYTGSKSDAGRFTLDEAERLTHPNGPDGPRDGLSYVHEDEYSEGWAS